MRSCLAMLLLLVGVGPVAAQAPEAAKRLENAKKAISTITPEREAAVMTFVKLNHADLEMLLTHLKTSDAKEYDKAVRELGRVIDRLAATKERDPDSYALELRSWKAQSRLQLLAARQSMGSSTEEFREQMREVINEQADVKAEMLKREKQRIEDRLAKIEQELTRLDKNRERFIEQQLKLLANAAAKSEASKPEVSQPAAITEAAPARTVAEPPANKKNNNKPNKPAVNADKPKANGKK